MTWIERSPDHWLELATQATAAAEAMCDPQAKLAMQRVAASYQALAKSAVRLAASRTAFLRGSPCG